MNKLIISLALYCIIISLDSFGQKGSELGFYYLPENTHISTNNNDSNLKNKFTLAGGGGISYTYNFSENIGIQIGGLYTSHNQKWTAHISNSTSYDWKGKKRLDYLNIPLLLRYRYKISPKVKSAFYLGAELSCLLRGAGGNVILKHNAGVDYFDLPSSSNNFYNKMICQAVTGWGLDFQINPKFTLNTAVRIEYSINDGANKKITYMDQPFYNYSSPNNNFKSHNWAIGLLMGISYKLPTKTDIVCPSDKWEETPNQK